MLDNTIPKEYLIKKEIESLLWSVFASFGYSEIGLKQSSLSLSKELAANVKKTDDLRLCCSTLGRADAARYAIALKGDETDCAKAEPIAAVTEALIALGIEDFHIKIGSCTFTAALLEKIDAKKADELYKIVAAKNKNELERLLGDSKDELTDILLHLDDMVGDEDIAERFGKLPKKASAALSKLADVFFLLTLYGFEKFPVIDLSVISDLGYDDLYFEIYISNSRNPVCIGGTIDGCVTAEFDVDMLAQLCGKEKKAVPKTLVYPEENANGIAYDIAFNLRINGCCIESYVGSGSFKDAEKYAKKSGSDCMIRVFSDGKLMIKNFNDGSIVETTAEDFLGYYDEDDECDCGHEHGECDCGHHHH